MGAVQSCKVYSGTHGTLWVDDEEIASLKSFQLKMVYNKADIQQ